MKPQIEVPSVIVNFFGNFTISNVPDGYVYLGLCDQKTFKEFPWKTKMMKPMYSGHEPKHPRFHVFVTITEVVEYILFSESNKVYLNEDQKQCVVEYAEKIGFESSKPISVKIKISSTKRSKTVELFEPMDLHKGRLGASIEIFFETDTALFTPSRKKQINLQRGAHKFVFIASPMSYETGTWLVLEKELPVIYGKSTVTWHQLLGYNPLS